MRESRAVVTRFCRAGASPCVEVKKSTTNFADDTDWNRNLSVLGSCQKSLWLRSCKNFLKSRSAAQQIPFRAQTEISERDATRIIRITDRAGSGKETFDQRDRLVWLT